MFSLLRYPDQSVLPILEVRHDGTPEAFLSTGFIVAPVAALVTAVMSSPVVRQPRTVFLLLRSRHTMPGTGNFDQFTIYSCRRQQTWRSLSFEALMVYGRSLLPVVARLPRMSMYLLWTTAQLNFRWIKKGRRVVRFSPGTLKGNVVRHYVSDFGSTRGMRCFDTSFLALAGASGAPVLLQPSLLVTGMLVVNVERHLHPSKILTVHERGTVTEEVYYHLPFGHALEADEVIAALETLGVSVDAARPSA